MPLFVHKIDSNLYITQTIILSRFVWNSKAQYGYVHVYVDADADNDDGMMIIISFSFSLSIQLYHVLS